VNSSADSVGRALRVLAIAGPLLLMLLLAWTPGISMTEDLGRHLLLGKIASEQHLVPKTNLLTYTHPDFPFVNHHWLSEVVLYQLHRLVGLNGLILIKMLLLCAALALALLTLKPDRGWALYWLAGILAAVMLAFRAHIRPELFTFLGVALYGWCFERIRGGAWWPKLVVLAYAAFWANAQIYFVFGLFMVAAFVLERWLQQRSRRALLLDLLWCAALAAVSSANPNGAAGLLYPFHIFSNYAMGITENSSPLDYWHDVLNPMLLALPIMTALAIPAAIAGWRSRLANSLIALAAVAAAWHMARSVPLLALAALPALGGALQSPVSGFRFQVSNLAGGILLLLLNLFLLFTVLDGSYSRVFPSPIAPTPLGFDDESRYTVVRGLKETGLRGPVFSDYNLGSLVEYNLYPEPGYVDNRPEAFPAAFWRAEYLPALGLGEAWDAISRIRQFNSIIVSLPGVKDSFTRELMRRPDWVLVHLDAICAVWVRNAPENQAFIDAHRFDASRVGNYEREIAERLGSLKRRPFWRRQIEADRIAYELYSLICIGEAERAWPYIWQLHQAYPNYQIAHELMRVTAPPDRIEAVKEVMAARARWPVAAKQVLDWGRVLESEGRIAEAKDAYRRGRRFFPRSPGLSRAIEQIEEEEYRRQIWNTAPSAPPA
jgi:hypothetical protein